MIATLIAQLQEGLRTVFDDCYFRLEAVDTPRLTELLHQAEDVRRRTAGSEYYAAQIVEVQVQKILDERKTRNR